MASNFDFLSSEPQFREFAQIAVQAERAMAFSPEMAAIYARKALETAVLWVYRHDDALSLPYRPQISALIYDASFQDIIPSELFPLLKYVIRMGNFAVHRTDPVSRGQVVLALKGLFSFLEWVACCYAATYEERRFDESLVPQTGADRLTAAELAKKKKELARQEEALAEKDADCGLAVEKVNLSNSSISLVLDALFFSKLLTALPR